MNDSKYNIEIDLSFLFHDFWDIDDAINYFIAYIEFHRGYLTGAFAEIINRYANIYPKELFNLFCNDIFKNDDTAVGIIHSLYGDPEILSSVEVLLQNLIEEHKQGEFGVKLETIRDTWLDRVIARGIESYRDELWEPNICFNNDIHKWSLQSIPISYKWYDHIKKLYDVSGMDAIEIMFQPCTSKYNTEQEAINAFKTIVKYVSSSTPDTVAEKWVMVKILNKYNGKIS